MKFSLNSVLSLNSFFKTTGDISAIGLDKLTDKIGAQLGAVEEVVDIGSKYQGVVVAKVVSCEKHPDADKLSICIVDAGKGENIQVVCGAPNVAAGQTVAWIPPGVTVPETAGKEPFVLEAREIRGVVSNGMIASPKELALSESHEGILVLDDWFKPGSDFAEAVGLKNDVVFDIENKMFTHRPDCFGVLGVSRELAGIQQMAFKSPDWYVQNPTFPKAEGDELKLTIKNELPDLVPRFSATVLSGVKVGPSPTWLVVELAKIGQKPINNIVDLTNYIMQLTGQPLHAYDYDKVKALSGGEAAIVVRTAKPGENLKLLNGKTVEPHSEAVIIATDKQAIGLGGVMGGAETEVDTNTSNIILECANFDMFTTRRTSMVHGLFTDAVTRFSKGQSPLQTLAVLAKITDAVRDAAGGKVAWPVLDDNHVPKAALERGSLHPPVKLSAGFINERLGEKLSASEIKKLLENVEFEVKIDGDELEVKAPFWRTDIELREDVVEEVGRLYGYDHLPLELPRRDLTPTARNGLLDAKNEIRKRLAKAGANEVLTYSFVPGDLLDKTGQDKAKAFQVANALSPDLQYYRISLMPSLLEKVHPNIKAGYDEFALFEIAKTHDLDHLNDDGLPREFEFTGLVVTAADKLKKSGAAYYRARKYLEALTGEAELVFKPVGDEMKKYPVTQPYDLNRAALVSVQEGDFLGIIGEFKPSVARGLKLPKYSAGFEVDSEALLKLVSGGPSYLPLLRFPGVKQDITLSIDEGVAYEKVADFVDKQLGANTPDDSHIAFEPADIYQAEGDKRRHYTFRITITGTNRTLTDKEVAGVLDKIADAAKAELKAERV